ncbi:MAG: sigma-70 family RNA polymerase sigma factor [candidate division KSB1 bacterium]|nr:sigma-70 family RNA polymerase sigma factor [candidate division KSB1 bacterium]
MNDTQTIVANQEAAAAIITSDDDVIRACQSGSRQAYGYLVNRYSRRAYYTALGLVGCHDSAMDLSQDAFVRAFRQISSFKPGSRFFTWYYRILRNLCLNYIRDKKRHARSFSECDPRDLLTLSDQTEDISQHIEQEEQQAAVWKVLAQIKQEEREIIVLKDFQNLSYKEIAECLNCPQGTVMSRLYHARRALKAAVERIYP